MKHLGRFCAGIILALSLTLSAYAGHIPCGITEEPQTSEATSEATATGDISCGLTDDLANLLLSLLSLF
jgi:lipoate-protein ligase B